MFLRASVLCLLFSSAYSFVTPALPIHGGALKLRGAAIRGSRAPSSAVKMMDERVERREAIASSILTAFGLTLASNKQAQAAGVALGYGVSEKDVNSQLEAFGLAAFNKASKKMHDLEE